MKKGGDNTLRSAGNESAPVYSATESRSATVDMRQATPGPTQTDAAKPAKRAGSVSDDGKSQLARKRGSTASAPEFTKSTSLTADADDNGVTYKPMRAYESGGKLPNASPDGEPRAAKVRGSPQAGTAPVLADDPGTSMAYDQAQPPTQSPATAAATDEQMMAQQQQQMQQQMMQEQWMSAMARARFMQEMQAQQMWAQQQQAMLAQQQYSMNFRRWMDGDQAAGSRADATANRQNGDTSRGSVHGSFLSILAAPSKTEEEDDTASTTASLSESRSGLYGNLSAYVIDDDRTSNADRDGDDGATSDRDAGESHKSRDIDLDENAHTDDGSDRDGEGEGGDVGDGGYTWVKQSSLFDINAMCDDGANTKTEDRSIPAPAPKPRATTSRTLSLAVVVEPCDRDVLKVTKPQTLATTDPSTKAVYEYDLDEVSRYDAKTDDTVEADLLDEVAHHVSEGHRAVLLVSVSDGAEDGGEALVRSALCKLLTQDASKSSESMASPVRVDVSAVVTRRGESARNLLSGLTTATSSHSLGTYSLGGAFGGSAMGIQDDGDDDNKDDDEAAFQPMVAAANPVAGHWIADTNFIRLQDDRDVESGLVRHITPWMHKSADDAQAADENLAVFATVVQEKGADKKLYLSSLLILVSRCPDEAYEGCTRPQKLPPAMAKLLKRVGHGVFSVAACCVSSQAGASVREYVSACRSLQAVHNSSMLSGNVQRYLTYANAQHTKAEERLNELRESDGSPRSIAVTEQALALHGAAIRDMEQLVDEPNKTPVQFVREDAVNPVAERSGPARAVEAQRGSPTMQTRELPTESRDNPQSAAKSQKTPQQPAAADEWRELGDSTSSKDAARKSRSINPEPPSSGTRAVAAVAAPVPAAAAVSFADRRVHVVAMVDTEASSYAIRDETTKAADGSTRMTVVQSASPTVAYVVDEAVTAASVASQAGAAPFSQNVTALCHKFASGHNCALISYDGRNNNLFESPAWSAVREAVRCALETPSNARDLRLSVTLLNSAGAAADLLVTASDLSPITIVASPLFGPVVDGARLVPIYSENDVRELLFTVAANIGDRWPGDTCLHVTVVSSISTRADVMVASFKASIFGSHHRFCSQVLTGAAAKPISALHRPFTHGIAASVLLLGFNNDHDAAHACTMVGEGTSLSAKMPLRDGSVRVFVQDTRKSLEKRSQKASADGDLDNRRRAEKVNRKIESMVSDYEQTLYEPATHFPKTYANGSDSAVSGIASGARAINTDDKRQNQKLHPYLVIGVERNGSVAPKMRINGRGVTWVPTGENFDADDTVVQYNNTGSKTVAAAFNGTGEVERLVSCARSGKNATIFGLSDVGGGNGADGSARATRPLQMQPWWLAYRNAVKSSVFLDNWDPTSTVQLRAVVLQDKMVVHDFLLSGPTTNTMQAPVKVTVSPIFGPVVANATVKEVDTAERFEELLALLEARFNAYSSQRNNTVVIIHALLRHVGPGAPMGSSATLTRASSNSAPPKTDVTLSSVAAVQVRVGQDLPALREVLALDPQGTVPYSLFRFPLTGTSRTVCVVDLDSCSDSRATESLRLAQRIRYFNTLPVPSGSVASYVAYESQRLAKGSSPGTTASAARTHTQDAQSAAMLAKMKSFYDRRGEGVIPLFEVQDPNAGAGDSPQSRGVAPLETAGAAKRQASKTVVVVTDREVVSPTASAEVDRTKAAPIRADVQAHTVTIDKHRFSYAEVVTRADNASVARPDLLRSAANNAIHGYNVALLMVDGTGSTSVSALLSRVITTIVSNKTERKLYLSVVALKHRTGEPDEVKDMLRVGDYTSLEVATSPLFGSCINGARFSQIKNNGDILVTLRDALSVCAVEKSVLVMTLVMRQKDPLYSDVTVNSLMAVISNADNTPSGGFPGQFLEDTLKEPDLSKRGLLRTCCGGQPYYTYGVVGVSGLTPPAEAQRLLQLGDSISQVMCRFPRPSSAKKLVEFAKKKLNTTMGAAATTPTATTPTGGEFIDEANWDWARIRDDTEKILENELSKPKAYILE